MSEASVAVTTRSYSNYRDGANLNEKVLTAQQVQTKGIRHLFDCILPGDERGTEGMPLLVPGRTINREAHDVLFVASMSNDVRAFDANTPNPETGNAQTLWECRVGNPIKSTPTIDLHTINDHWGILSTPVINMATGTLYIVALTSADGLIDESQLWLYAMDIDDGSDQAPPLNLNNAAYHPPNGLGTALMSNAPRKQRCGLVFDSRNGVDTVIVASGSFNENATTNQGWVIVCDVSDLKLSIAACWTTTSRYPGAGIWQGGQGLSIDDEGYIYGMSGNGAFDGITDFGESFYKLKYTPKSDATPASLTIVDWFTPFTDTGRVGADPTIAYIPPMPGGVPHDEPSGPSNRDDPNDEDLNSGGPLLLPATLTGYSKDVVLGAGKDGIVYVLDTSNMGKTALADFSPDKIAGNYAKLLSPPYGLTYYPIGIDLAPINLSTIPTTPFGRTHHMHATPVFYKSSRFGCMLFAGGENGPVRAFKFNSDFSLTYLGCGAEVASAEVPNPGGMPGTMITLSANGSAEDTAVLWCLQPYNDANKTISRGRLIAYGADWIQNGALTKIWDSQDWGIQITHNKFNIATCANGKLYVPGYDARVMVFG